MSSAPKILIVDDDLRMCESLKELLSSQGYELKTSNSAKKAIENLEKDTFDLVLLDIFMPEEYGYKVMDYITSQSLDTLVIVMTGHASTESAIKALRKGAHDYIKKPFEPEELLARLKNAINHKRLESKSKQIEEALRKSEEKFRNIVESSPIGIHMYKLEHDGQLVFTGANPTADAILGIDNKQFVGKTIEEAFPSSGKTEVPERYRRVCATGEPWHTEQIDYEDEQIKGAFEVHAFQTSSGVMATMFRDITERRQREKALKESYETLVTVLNSIDADVYVADMKTYEIIFMNKHMQDSFGHDSTGKICWDVLRGESEPCSFCTNHKLLDTEGNPTGVIVWKDKNPLTERWYINYDRAVKWIDGRFVRLQIATDITELKKSQEEKEKLEFQFLEAQKMESIGTLAGGLAHDFNNLLMGIQGRTFLMLMDTDSSHPHIEHLKGIEEYVGNAVDLTRQLLGFARGGKYEVKPADLNELIDKSSDMFGRTKKEITIHKKNQMDLWTVEVDQSQIKQVLLNLYVNAWQSMPGGGELFLETENVMLDDDFVKPYDVEPGKYVKISVTDTGVGMDKATQERIFNPFFTTKEMGRGTGLGLASAYGIIKNHGGIINVSSKKGKGATFNIYLPASEKEVVKDKALSIDIIKGTETILLVDDEDIIIDVSKELLKKLGYKVLIAKSGKSAVELYEGHKNEIDMVILDMTMPDMGGGDTYDRLKELYPNIKVLLSSGYSIDGQATEILERSCNGFIQKPFNISALSQKIREILDKD